ncbi:MAG: DUF4163 domain-containing protein [Lachnospiraceae bacterium]|nr:DUF4163 domain-containing protein [Lachnospiraceae bacterium]
MRTKKIMCIMLAMTMMVLSACTSVTVNNTVQPADDAKNEANDVVDGETVEAVEAVEAAEKEEIKDAAKPVYKLVRQYFGQYYEGTNKTDGDGEPLEGKKVYDGTNQTIMLADESKELYPDLYENLNAEAKKEIEAAKKYADSMIGQANEDADSSVTDKRPFIGPWTDYVQENIIRADRKVISYTRDFSSFSGGAHGIYGKSGITYDVKTGKRLVLTDVVDTTKDNLVSVLKEKLLKMGEERDEEDGDVFFDLDETLEGYSLTVQNDPANYYEFSGDDAETETDTDTETDTETGFVWYLGYDGIHFYFGPYELAAYALGDWEVIIGYDEFPGTVKEQYLPNTDEGYVTASFIPVWSSDSDDSSDDSLHFTFKAEDEQYDDSEYIDATSLTLKKGSKEAVAEDEYFSYSYSKNSSRQYRVVTADNREYIYVDLLTFNDYTDVVVFDITGGDIKLAGVHTCHLVYEDTGDDTYAGEFIPTDPDNMYYAEVGDLLGTYTCYGRYVVGPDGLPQFADSDYRINWGSEDVTSLKDITVTVLDEKGNETGEEAVPAGTHFVPVRTDNKTYMDCTVDGERTVRLKYTKTDYPAEIDGISVDDLFDGLIYAG